MYSRSIFFFYIFPPNTFLYALISTHLDYCWWWSPMKILSITFGTLTKKVTIVENENNKLYLIVSEFNVNNALWINSIMCLIFMPDNTRLSCGIKQILEPVVTCDTKQCLSGLLLPAAKNSFSKTLFCILTVHLAIILLQLPWKSRINRQNTLTFHKHS